MSDDHNPSPQGGENTGDPDAYRESAPKQIEDIQVIIKDVLIPLEKNENFSKHLDKFYSNIKHSFEQVEGKVSLVTIQLPNESDDAIAHNPAYIKKLDKIVEEWGKEIDRTLTNIKTNKPEIKSASMEIDHWRRTVSTLSNLSQQLKQEYVKRVKNILEKSEESIK